MTKPDGKTRVEHHHYATHLGATFLCEHTCQKGFNHKDDAFHDKHNELKTLPNKKRTHELVDHFMAELYAHDKLLPPHLYAAIWHQFNVAKL